ncbi:MAG: helix-turn-helix domain-containing protein [Spirochaetaceae bacterium]|nr:helix-turn-helix domain-containing protein [Spirochaetaceae bacterium]
MDYVRACLSSNLKIRRAMMGISQEDLAELAGISSGYIANIETGRSFPSTKVLLKLSQAFKIEHWKLLVDPQKDEIAYTKEEISQIFDQAKSYVLGELPNSYLPPRKLLNDEERTRQG